MKISADIKLHSFTTDNNWILAMQEIEGKIIPTEIEEIVHPSHTALVVMGVQNSAVDLIFNKNEFMTSLNSIVQSAREKKSLNNQDSFLLCSDTLQKSIIFL